MNDADPSNSKDLVVAEHVTEAPIDLESILEWTRRAAEDRTEVAALLDELDAVEMRALIARLVQLVALLELCPADVDPSFFIDRVASLGGDFAADPWSTDGREQ